MRRLTVLLVAAVVLVGCGGTTVTDPYQIVDKSASATYDVVQVNVGLTVAGSGPTGSASTVTIDPSALQLIIDRKGGKAGIKVHLPVADLGADARSLAQLGITTGTLDLEIVYDGDALYANGPVLTTLLTALMTQAGLTPGDMTGWLRLGTKAEFEALAGQIGGGLLPSAIPSMAAIPSHDAASIKKGLEDVGVTLTYVGAEKRAGVDAAHLSVAVDATKLTSSPAFANVPSSQAASLKSGLQQVNLAADVWINSSSYRLVEIDLHVTARDGTAGRIDVTILVSQPTDASGLSAPASYNTVPLSQLLGELLKTLGPGLLSQ